MNPSLYDLLWYFFIYSFSGWCLEIGYAAVKEKKFLNRGVLNGPLCPIYGIGMVANLTFLNSLKGNFLFLTIGCGVTATVLEFFTGAMMERLFKKRWWDYSDHKFNISGHVCLPFSVLWGVGAALSITFIQPLLRIAVAGLLSLPGRILLMAILAAFSVDVLSVFGVIFQITWRHRQIDDLAIGMQQVSSRLGRSIFSHIEKRMAKAHPILLKKKEATDKTRERSASVFACGCGFHKVVWLFFIGALLGDVTETIFCYFTMGKLMSRSSVVYGPFSIVWGLGVVVLTIMLHRYRDKDDRYIFLFGTIVGGVYEYICSVFTELVFGTVFWDYSKIPFNLGGRINLLYCFFWGVAAVVWIKIFYPRISGLIEKIPVKTGRIVSWCIIAFMAFNIVISALALGRYSRRTSGQEAAGPVDVFLDERFPDERMEWIYPNAILRN